MKEDLQKDTKYLFELKRITDEDETSSNITDIPSDSWSDELAMDSSTPNPQPEETKSSQDISYSFLYGKDIDESKPVENVDLYGDLIQYEEEEKKARQKFEAEFKSCKEELEKLRKSNAEKSASIVVLQHEKDRLLKAISSMYKTAESEIDRKDKLLAEAHRKNSRMEYALRNNTCLKCQDRHNEERDKSSNKRKRSVSPKAANNKKDCRSATSDSQNSVNKNRRGNSHSPDSRTSKLNQSMLVDKDKVSSGQNHTSKLNKKQDKEQNNDIRRISVETQTANFPENSEGLTEMNQDASFNMLPESVKKSIYEYEKSLISSFNRLKKTFIDECLNSFTNVQSPILECASERQKVHPKEIYVGSNPQNVSSVNNTANCEPQYQNISTERSAECASKINQNKDNIPKVRTCDNTKSIQKDVVSLFRYRNEKIPFLDKRKFGLLKNGKKSTY